LTPNWDKRFLTLTGPRFAGTSLPLSAIYLIAAARDDVMAPSVTTLSARQALLELVAHTQSIGSIGPSLREREYWMLGRLVRALRIRRLVPHTGIDRVQRLCDVIEEDVRACTPAAPARGAFQ
jgi:hypothetical protein